MIHGLREHERQPGDGEEGEIQERDSIAAADMKKNTLWKLDL